MTGKMNYLKIGLLALTAATALAAKPLLTCTPRELHGIPGEPLKLEVTVETDRVLPVQIRIPSVTNLVLRMVEKIPIQRTENGRYIQKRIIIWQGIEAGSTSLTNLAVHTETDILYFPAVEIAVGDVTPAEPPTEELSE